MPRKPKTPQKENLTEVNGRDLFQTPNYAVDLLVPFIPKDVKVIWECAAGLQKIVHRLGYHGFDVISTDLQNSGFNFLTDSPEFEFDCIVTNSPFSLKRKFYEQCKGYGVPFALLLPADYATWLVNAVDKDHCEKIIPTRRIDYVTPNILVRIHEGEIWETVREKYPDGAVNDFKKNELAKFKKEYPVTWAGYLEDYKDFCKWDSIYDVPAAFLKKYSSSYYHSMWLTRGFDIGRSETFVELTNKDKLNI